MLAHPRVLCTLPQKFAVTLALLGRCFMGEKFSFYKAKLPRDLLHKLLNSCTCDQRIVSFYIRLWTRILQLVLVSWLQIAANSSGKTCVLAPCNQPQSCCTLQRSCWLRLSCNLVIVRLSFEARPVELEEHQAHSFQHRQLAGVANPSIRSANKLIFLLLGIRNLLESIEGEMAVFYLCKQK